MDIAQTHIIPSMDDFIIHSPSYIPVDLCQQLFRHHYEACLLLLSSLCGLSQSPFPHVLVLGQLFRIFLSPLTTVILLCWPHFLQPVLALQALTHLSAFYPRVPALAVLLLTVALLAIASPVPWPHLRQLSNVLLNPQLPVFSLRRLVPLILLIVMTPNTHAVLTARNTLRKAFAIHLQAPCFLAMTSLFLWL